MQKFSQCQTKIVRKVEQNLPKLRSFPGRYKVGVRYYWYGSARAQFDYIGVTDPNPPQHSTITDVRIQKPISIPSPPEDERRYLTIVHPYPLNANLQLHADRRTFTLWLACCTGKNVLLAMFYKPTVSLTFSVMSPKRAIDGTLWDHRFL